MYYQKLAENTLTFDEIKYRSEREKLIKSLKESNNEKLIGQKIKKFDKDNFVSKRAHFLYGNSFDDYIHDMKLLQQWAHLNREKIIKTIGIKFNLNMEFYCESVHNYIDTDNMILRKGSVSAQAGEKLIIPLNMSAGSILAIGKGNPDWNYSAPHGAGRLMSRSKAKQEVTLEEFEKSMEGIYSTSVKKSTIDESPMAYKDASEIIEYVQDTIDIVDIIKPIYNFKA